MKLRKLLIFILFWMSFVAFAQFPELFNTTTFPSSWLVTNNGVGTGQSWTAGATNAPVCEGTRQARCQRELISAGSTSEDWLISPQFQVPNNGQVIFSSRTGSAGNQGTLFKVYYSTNATQANLGVYQLLQTYNEDQLSALFNVCDDTVLNLPTATFGQNIFLAFVREYTQPTADIGGDIIFLDNIRIVEQCLVPTTLATSNLTHNSVTLSWAPPGLSDVFVILSTGAAPTNASTPTHPNVTSPVTITGLTPNTTYKFYVRSKCANNINSDWSLASTNFTTPVAPLGCGGNFVDSGGATGNYAASENSVTTICPPAGQLATVFFTAFQTETNWDRMYIYDGNSTSAPLMPSTNGGGSGAPCNTVAGGYWGTQLLNQTIIATSPSGCLTFRFCSDSSVQQAGWLANIVCIPAPGCDKPTNLTVTNTTLTSATLNWTDNGLPASSQWELIILPATAAAPTNGQAVNPANVVTSNTFNAINLANCQALRFYVRAICANGNGNSFWSASAIFSTPASNNECSNAISVPVNNNASCTNVIPGCLSGATASSQANACVGSADDDVWFSFVATSTTHIISLLNITGTTTDLVHVLYSGTCSALTQLNCSDANSSVVNNLIVGQTYYIRVFTNATTAQTVNFNICVGVLPNCSTAQPFCTGTGVVFNNSTGVPSLGTIGCLNTTPNPAWFFLQINNPGDLRLNISQTSNTGAALDVDYVAWGPFNSTAAACAAIPTNPLPDGDPPGGNALHGCSYSASNVEYMYLPTVTTGQVYMVLITNFSNQAGTITFNQSGGTASTDCTILCPQVTLPADITLCAATTSTTINATTTTTPTAYQWFLGTTLLPNTTSQLIVTQSGTYKCIVSKPGCPNHEDTIVVTFTPQTIPSFTQVPSICSGGLLSALPTTSTNGVTGTWSPALNNLASTVYTFTPTAGQCATSTTMTIDVNNCNAFIYASAVWMDDCTTVGDGKFYNTNGSGVDLISQDGSVFQQNYGVHVQNSGTLILRGAEVKTQKGNSSNICSANLHYRIFTGTPSGTFTTRNLQFFSDCNTGAGTFVVGGGPCATGQQKWQCVSQPAPCDAPFDFTTLTPGVYTIQVYYTATGSYNTTNGCSDTITLDNGGAYYTATFTIQAPETITSTNPTTCAGNSGTITLNNLAPNTAYTISYQFNSNTVGPNLLTSNATGQIILNNLSAGTYTNITTLINGCSRINSTVVNLVIPTIPTVTVNNPTFCTPGNTTVIATPGTAGTYNYVWTVPAGVTNPGNVATFTTTIAGNYCVTITNTTTLCSSTNVCGVVTSATQPNAGTNGSLALCNGTIPTTQQLFSSLGGTPQTGGTWSNVGLLYTYTVTGTAPCTNATANVQITYTNTPLINLGPNQTICVGESTTLTATPGFTSYLWSTGATTQSITVNQPGTYSVTGTITTPSTINLVSNSGFTNGITGYTSQYALGTGGTWGLVSNGLTYAVVTSPSLAHNHLANCPNTTGTMFVANGGNTVTNANVLCQTINVQPNTNYTFSVDAINPHNDAGWGVLNLTLGFQINGQSMGSFSPPLSPNNCNWQTYSSNVWNSGTNTSVSICIKNLTPAANLLAIDNLRFSPSINCTSTGSITINQQANANAGTNGTLTVCQGTTPTNAQLFAALNGTPDANGTWSNNGLVYTYTVNATAPCTTPASATVTVTEQAQPNAGTNGTIVICSGTTVTASQLFAQLGGTPSSGGTWSPALAGAGVYTYTVNAIAPCTTPATATVTVTAQALPNAGTNGNLVICSGTTVTTAQLFAALGGAPNTGGTWSPALAGAGVYTYTINAIAPCAIPATATVTVTAQGLPNAGTNGTLVICSGTTVTASQLFAALGGTPNTGGTWSPALAGAGVYTYTVNAIAPCAIPATATVTVTAQALPNAGTNGTLVICSGTTVTASQLLAQLGGTPSSGGTWSPALAGAGVYTYTVNAIAPCTTPANATVTVTAQALPNAGTNGNLVICSGTTVTTAQLFAALGGTPNTGGTWSPALAGAGVYTYTVNAIAPCTTPANATVTVTAQALPNAGTNGNIVICSGTTVTTAQLFAALGGAPNTGGTWSPALAGAGVYTYTVNATAPCTGSVFSIVTVTNYNTSIALTTANDNQEVCKGTLIFPIVYTLGIDVTEVQISNLPDGITASFNSVTKVLTITGSSVEVGDYTYTITPKRVNGTNICNGTTITGFIKIKSCLIQNGISPGDGNGQNDVFDLRGYNVSQLFIYNRYGMKVYEKPNYINEWGGQDLKGNELPTGTYFYVIEFKDGSEAKSGWIYVNRAQ
jgi:gliding motility-associated-like protein